MCSLLQYLPALVPIVGTVAHSSSKIKIASREAPEVVCGLARRVGYTGTLQTDLAIYRLRVKASPDLLAVTLTDFFVLEGGIFHLYKR